MLHNLFAIAVLFNQSPMTIKAKKAQLNLLEIIKTGEAALRNKTVSLGFDAFVDSVVKVIRQKDVDGKAHYFESTLAFGEYIVDKGKKSFSIEMEEITNKLGGNMPIMANAVAQMGPKVSCIGPMGRDAIHPVFRPMQEYCELYSYADPGLTKVLEFPSGKMIFVNNLREGQHVTVLQLPARPRDRSDTSEKIHSSLVA